MSAIDFLSLILMTIPCVIMAFTSAKLMSLILKQLFNTLGFKAVPDF